MARLLRDWLQHELLGELRLALEWRQKQIAIELASQIKREPGLEDEDEDETGADGSDDDADKFGDNCSTITVDLTRPTSANSFVQILKFTAFQTLCQGIITDGYTNIPVIFDDTVVEKLEKTSARKIEQLEGCILTLRAFKLLICRHGDREKRLMLLIESAKFRQGSLKSGFIGHPKPILGYSDCQAMLESLRIMDSELDDPAPVRPCGNTAVVTNTEPEPDPEPEPISNSQQGTASSRQQTQSDGGILLASQVPPPPEQRWVLSPNPPPDRQNPSKAPNMAPPDAVEVRVNKLLALQGRKPQPYAMAFSHKPDSQTKSLAGSSSSGTSNESQSRPKVLDHAITSSATKRQQAAPKVIIDLTDDDDAGLDAQKSSLELPTKHKAPVSGPAGKLPVHTTLAVVDLSSGGSETKSVTVSGTKAGKVEATKVEMVKMEETSAPAKINLVESTTTPSTIPATTNLPAIQPPARPVIASRESITFATAPAKDQSPTLTVNNVMLRKPDERYLTYARRRIPKDQANLLEKKSSWLPSFPSLKFPPSNVPLSVLQAMEAQYTARKLEQSPTKIAVEPAERIVADRSNTVFPNGANEAATKGSMHSATTDEAAEGVSNKLAQPLAVVEVGHTTEKNAAPVHSTSVVDKIAVNGETEAAADHEASDTMLDDPSSSSHEQTLRRHSSPELESSQIPWSPSPSRDSPVRQRLGQTPPDSSALSVVLDDDIQPGLERSASCSEYEPLPDSPKIPEDFEDGDSCLGLDLDAQLPRRLDSSARAPAQPLNTTLVEVQESPFESSLSFQNQHLSEPVPATQLSTDAVLPLTTKKGAKRNMTPATPRGGGTTSSSRLHASTSTAKKPSSTGAKARDCGRKRSPSRPQSTVQTGKETHDMGTQADGRGGKSPPRKRQRTELRFASDEVASQDPAKKHATNKKRELLKPGGRSSETEIPGPFEPQARTSSAVSPRPASSSSSIRSFGTQTAWSFPTKLPHYTCVDPALAAGDDGRHLDAASRLGESDVMVGEGSENDEIGYEREKVHKDDAISDDGHEEGIVWNQETCSDEEMELDDVRQVGDLSGHEVEESDSEDDDDNLSMDHARQYVPKARVWNSTTFGSFGSNYHALAVVEEKLNDIRPARHINVLGWRLGGQQA